MSDVKRLLVDAPPQLTKMAAHTFWVYHVLCGDAQFYCFVPWYPRLRIAFRPRPLARRVGAST